METINRVYVGHDDVCDYCREHPGVSQEDAARDLAKRAGLKWPGHAQQSEAEPAIWCVWIRRDRYDMPHRKGHA